MNQIIFFLILFSIMSVTCSSPERNSDSKFDAPLRQKLASLDDKSDVKVEFLGKCNAPINDEMKSQLVLTGIDIQTIINEIFTASGTPAQIKKTAEFNFVSQLQLSTERKIK